MKLFPYHCIALLSTIPLAEGALTVSDFSTAWTPLVGNFDYLVDQQTGQPESDIVGAGINYGMLIGFDDAGSASHTDGDLFFRVRLDKENNGGYNDVMWIGIDANVDGALDAFLALNTKTNPDEISIHSPGTGLNNSPSTTTIGSGTTIAAVSSTNYNYRAVTTNDGGDSLDLTPSTSGDTDFYLSFVVPFQTVVNFLAGRSITITDQSPLRYISATSTNANALNQDLGGVNDKVDDLTKTWSELGAFSQTSPTLIPEPSSALLTLGSLASALLLRRRR